MLYHISEILSGVSGQRDHRGAADPVRGCDGEPELDWSPHTVRAPFRPTELKPDQSVQRARSTTVMDVSRGN